jgi:hypothetical protein
MRHTPRRPLVPSVASAGRLLAATLGLVCAHCGDPVAGTWTNTMIPTPPAGSSAQYTMYSVTLTFGDGMTLSVDLEATRTKGAITYAGCVQSITAMGSYTEQNNTLTSMFQSVSNTRSSCTYPADNQMSTTLDSDTMTLLNGLTSGSFAIANNVMTLTTSGGTKLMYNKMAM